VAVRRRNLFLTFGVLAAAPTIGAGFVLGALLDGGAIVAASLGGLYFLLFPIVAAASMGLRRHAEEHERLAKHDVLTGIPNRLLFTRRLEDLLARGEPVAVIVADVDHLKDVNDRFGHGTGDEVLRRTAALLGASLRSTDTVARLGGDEFGIVLPGAGREEARLVARRIVAALPVPASLGLAWSPDHGTGFDALLQAADFAMYEAKQQGGGYRLAEVSEEAKAPGQAIGGLRPVRRAAPAKAASGGSHPRG
jgi:diguanylate cyclase (GGDEF)-like protein